MLIRSASVVAQVLRESGGHHIIHVHHYIKMLVVRLSVCPLRKVSGNDLTSRQKMLYMYLWLPSVRGYSWAISMSGSHGTSYRHEY